MNGNNLINGDTTMMPRYLLRVNYSHSTTEFSALHKLRVHLRDFKSIRMASGRRRWNITRTLSARVRSNCTQDHRSTSLALSIVDSFRMSITAQALTI